MNECIMINPRSALDSDMEALYFTMFRNAEKVSLKTAEAIAIAHLDDNEIITRIRSGETQWSNQLVQKYARALLGFLLGRAAMSREDAEDMAQDIWARALSDLHTTPDAGGYDPQRGSFYTYLIHRYAKFHVLQYLEAKRRRVALSYSATEDGSDPADQPFLADDNDPETLQLRREDMEERHDALCRCFRMTFLFGGYPHQVLAFAYSKLVYGKSTQRESDAGLLDHRRKREVEGDPKRLDAEHGSEPLHKLFTHFWEAFQRISGMDSAQLQKFQAYLEPTRERMQLTVAAMSQGNKVFLDHHAHLADRVVGETNVRDYYGTRGLNAIPDWCDKVQNRVRERLGISRKQ